MIGVWDTTLRSTECVLERPCASNCAFWNVEVGTAEVIAPRTLNEIIRDIQALGYREEDQGSGIDALQHPGSHFCTKRLQERPEVAEKWPDSRTMTVVANCFKNCS